MLELYGLRATGAINGQEALDKVTDQIGCCELLVIFMDVNMPIMGGIESTHEIQKLYKTRPDLKPPCIVALTASNSKEEEERCLKEGLDVFLSKPPDQVALQRVLIQTCGKENVILDN